MSTLKTTESPPIPAADLAELEEAVADIIQGVRRPEKMEEAARELAEGREEIRRQFGLLDIAARLTDRDEDDE